MDTQQVLRRIARIRAAAESVREGDLSKFRPTVTATADRVVVEQDFTGGMTEAALEFAVNSLIHEIASVRDHLRGFARRSGKSPDPIDQAFGSGDLRVFIALDNRDKHGPPRPGGTEPDFQLRDVARGLQLVTGAEAGSAAVVEFTPAGPISRGDAASGVEVVIDGEVVDGTGRIVGQLHAMAESAVLAVEALARDLGVL